MGENCTGVTDAELKHLLAIGDQLADKAQRGTLGVDPHAWDWKVVSAHLREHLGLPPRTNP